LGIGDGRSNLSNDRHRYLSGGDSSKKRFITTPRKINVGGGSLETKDAACGEKHTCLLQQNGVLITIGANDAGQLGIGCSHDRKGNQVHTIQKIRRGPKMLNFIPFREIACGNNHCAAIASQDGSIYTWGWGKIQTGSLA